MKKIFTLLLVVLIVNLSKAQTPSNGGMETWKSYTSILLTMERPNDWYALDSIIGALKQLALTTYAARVVKSSTVKNSGSFSARLYTASGDSFPTLLSNGNVKFDLSLIADLTSGDFSKLKFSGGTSVSKRVHFAKAYVQYSSGTTADTGIFTVTAFKNGYGVGGTDSIVGTGRVAVVPSTGFVKREVYISYVNGTVVPDRLVFTFNAGANFPPTAGNEMYVDDVSYSDPTGIEMPAVNESSVRIYPNPAKEHIQIQTAINESLFADIFSVTGQKVLSQALLQQGAISIASLTAGSYIITLRNDRGHLYYGATLVKE